MTPPRTPDLTFFLSQNPDDVTKLLDKWFGLMEGQLPAEGFINGLSFPTAADCAVLNITSAYMPMGAAMKMAQYDTSLVKFPKVKALADRTAVAEGIAGNFPTAYTNANPFGM